MTRAIYVSLLRLHPRAFQRQFGGEMLWIFDEARVSEGAFVLLLDLLISVLRQWLLRSGIWKVAMALSGAAIQVTAGGVGWWFFNPRIASRNTGAQMTPLLSEVMLLALGSFGIVFVMVFISACWVTRFNRRRVR